MTVLATSWREAREHDVSRYFTGKPCKRGHIAERIFPNGNCIECNKLAHQRHYDKSPERRKEQWRRSHQRHALYYQQYKMKHRDRDRTLNLEQRRRYYANNRSKALRWAKAAKKRRRARKHNVLSTFTPSDWRTLCSRSMHCHWCKRPFNKQRRPTHDHVIPLSKGGTDTLQNSCCACRSCNVKKQAKLVNPATGQGILL